MRKHPGIAPLGTPKITALETIVAVSTLAARSLGKLAPAAQLGSGFPSLGTRAGLASVPSLRPGVLAGPRGFPRAACRPDQRLAGASGGDNPVVTPQAEPQEPCPRLENHFLPLARAFPRPPLPHTLPGSCFLSRPHHSSRSGAPSRSRRGTALLDPWCRREKSSLKQDP